MLIKAPRMCRDPSDRERGRERSRSRDVVCLAGSAPGEFVAEVVLRAMFDLKLRENWDKGTWPTTATTTPTPRPTTQSHRPWPRVVSPRRSASLGAPATAMIGDRNRTIVYFDRSISITYYRIGAIGTVSSRDFLDLRSLNQLEGNQGFLVVFHSVDWHQQPLVNGSVPRPAASTTDDEEGRAMADRGPSRGLGRRRARPAAACCEPTTIRPRS